MLHLFLFCEIIHAPRYDDHGIEVIKRGYRHCTHVSVLSASSLPVSVSLSLSVRTQEWSNIDTVLASIQAPRFIDFSDMLHVDHEARYISECVCDGVYSMLHTCIHKYTQVTHTQTLTHTHTHTHTKSFCVSGFILFFRSICWACLEHAVEHNSSISR